MQVVVAVVHVNEPGEDVTVYPVISEPPVLDGADHETATEESPKTPDTPVGAPATVAGTTASEAVDAEPVPALLEAFTVNVYAVPLVSPVTSQVMPVAGDGVQVLPATTDPAA